MVSHTRAPASSEPSKFARYRARKRTGGRKLLRIWVLDPDAPGLADEIARQVTLMNEMADEAEVMNWIEAVNADLELPPYEWGPDGPPPG